MSTKTDTAPNPCKVLTGKCRMSYVFLNAPRPAENEGDPARYMSDFIIPKSDTAAIERINAAIEQAKKNGLAGTKRVKGWTEKTLKSRDFVNPLRDGDEREDSDPAYANAYYLSAKSQQKPKVVDRDLNEIIDADLIYSGIYGRATLEFWPFDNKSKGIGCTLINVQKLADGDALGGARSKPEDDFAEAFEDEADDMM